MIVNLLLGALGGLIIFSLLFVVGWLKLNSQNRFANGYDADLEQDTKDFVEYRNSKK